MKTFFQLWQNLEISGDGNRTKFVGIYDSRTQVEDQKLRTIIPPGPSILRSEFEVVEFQTGREPPGPGPAFAYAISWIPLASFIVAMLFPFVTLDQPGHRPYAYQPDPTTLNQPGLRLAAMLAFPAGLLSLCAGTFWLFGAPKAWRKWPLVVFLTGVLLWAWNLNTLGDVFAWLMD